MQALTGYAPTSINGAGSASTITLDPETIGARTPERNLANALTALESTLKAMLSFLQTMRN